LLQIGCNPKAWNNEAICLASKNGHRNVVYCLLEAGCNPQAWKNFSIRTAAQNGYKSIVCALYDAAYLSNNPMPRNITPEVERILDERIGLVSVIPMLFSKLAWQYQTTSWMDIAPQILMYDKRLHD